MCVSIIMHTYVCMYICKVILKIRNDLKFGIGMPVCSYSTFASLSKIDDKGNEDLKTAD